MNYYNKQATVSCKKTPDWDISNKGKVYTSNEIEQMQSMPQNGNTIQVFALAFKRDLSGILVKLDRLGVLKVHENRQKLADNIDEIKYLTYFKLQNKIDSILGVSKVDSLKNNIDVNESFTVKALENIEKSTINNNLTTGKKEQKMSHRRTVTVELFDDSQGLDVEFSRVFSAETVTESQDQNLIIQQLMLDAEANLVGEAIKKHNALRLKKVDEAILKNTGNKVMLREVKIKDLRWSIK